MVRRLITLCIFALAWAFMATAAFAHGQHDSISHSHDHTPAVHAVSIANDHPAILLHADVTLQSACVDCTGDHDANHNCECCFPGNHYYMCQLSVVTLDLRRSLPMQRYNLGWQVPDGQNPSGLERPPKI
ncbi:MAG: hypothetical protein EBY21_09900 [Alphaproteobacteria bacterium]|nr:hypothetical protein [Alphaproteobacteria bacterium]